jgi:hypothetical protein
VLRESFPSFESFSSAHKIRKERSCYVDDE